MSFGIMWRMASLFRLRFYCVGSSKSIRVGSSSKKMKGICETIMARMMKHLVALKWGIGENRMAPNLETSSVLDCIALLVDLISRSGEALDAYIQTHSEAPHVEVLEHVSSILKDHGFSCNGEGIDITNLRPYDCKMFAKSYQFGGPDANNVAAGMAYPHATSKKAGRNRLARAGNLEHTRNSFFPYWRSVLLTNVDVTVFPDYAAADPKYMLNLNKQHRNSVVDQQGSSPSIRSHSLAFGGKDSASYKLSYM